MCSQFAFIVMPKHHLSFEEKKELLKLYNSGVPISRLAAKNNLSRAVIYKWIKDPQYAKKSAQVSSLDHWKGYSQAVQKKIVFYSLKHPDFSAELIAQKLNLGHNGVWRVLKKNNLSTKSARLNHLASPAYQIKKSPDPKHKIEMIHRYYIGESATDLCREFGVSRTIFYKWLNLYRKSHTDSSILASRRPKKIAHWRFVPEARKRVMEIVRAHPEFSAHAISAELRKRSLALSHNTVHTILREHNLSRYHARVAFAGTFSSVAVPVRSSLPTSRPVQLFLPAPREISSPKKYAVTIKFPFGQDALKSVIGVLIMTGFGVYLMVTSVFAYKYFTTNSDTKLATNVVSQNSVMIPTPVPTQPVGAVAGVESPEKSAGVLAVNTDKSVYKVGDTVSMIFGVVDGAGVVECGADVEVTVIGPDRTNKTYRTNTSLSSENRIQKGETCDPGVYSVLPDYWTYYHPTEPGLHNIVVTAKTKTGTISSNQQITVLSDEEYATLPYVIKRTSMPTRVRPDWTYRGEVQVEFHQDFSGVLREKIDSRLRLNAVYTQEAKESGSGEQIEWNVQGSAGETKSLVYSIGPVQDSSQSYLMGPANLEMDGGVNNYTWQVVVSKL